MLSIQHSSPLAKHYRELLREELGLRKSKNPSYSMRSFSRDLKVSVSMLSDVLAEKRSFTRKTALMVLSKLNLSSLEQELFIHSVELEQKTNQSAPKQAKSNLSSFGRVLEIKKDQTHFIEDPLHLAALALFGIKKAKVNDLTLVKKFGLFLHEAQKIIQRLIRLGAIHQESHELKLKNDFIYSADCTLNLSIQKFHLNCLNRAAQSIKTDPITERDFQTYIYAIDQQDFANIQKEVADFQRTLYERYAQKASANRVYSIQIQCIPISKKDLP